MNKGKYDRGIYRSIYVALWDDPRFLELSPEERMILLYLRTSPLSNLIGLYRFYKEAICTHTGLPDSLCNRVLDTLSHRDWIAIDQGLVWVKNALKYDPTVSLANPKHMQAVRTIVAGLPKLKIVADFCTYYGISIPYSIPYAIRQ